MAGPGIGPWTVNYIKLRVCKDPNAFVHNDWVVLKQLATTSPGVGGQCMATVAQFALMYLWFAAAQIRSRQD